MSDAPASPHSPAASAETETDPTPPGRCGFVALVGAPNAGKSTLTNALVGAKVAIVTPKAQTTRFRVLGIALVGPSQLILVDTPGIFTPKRRLDRSMVAAAWQGAEDADIVALLVDATAKKIGKETQAIIDRLAAAGREAVLVLNKVDAVARPSLLDLSAKLNAAGRFSATFMVSALTGDGLDSLRDHLAAALPEGPWLYPEDELSDLPERLLAAEITREKLFLKLRQELPYAATVETEEWTEFEDGSVRIAQVIFVQRDSQKAIVLGKGGQMIKTIGAAARQELEALLERRVHLSLFVKVRDNWVDDPERYSPWGLDYNV